MKHRNPPPVGSIVPCSRDPGPSHSVKILGLILLWMLVLLIVLVLKHVQKC